MKSSIYITDFRTLKLFAMAVASLVFAGDVTAGTIPALSGPNLMVHLKADAPNVALNGSNVSQWNDISGSGNDFVQATAAAQPLWVDNVLNGQPVLRFDGSNDWLSVIGNGLAAMDTPFSFFAVTAGTDDPFALFDSAPNNVNTFRTATWSGVTGGIDHSVEFHNGSPALPLVINPTGSIISVRGSRDGSNQRVMDLNEISDAGFNSSSGVGGTAPVLFVGGGGLTPNIGTINQGTAGYFNGDLAEVIIYSGTLDDAQRNEVEAYLGAEYGIPVPEPSAMLLAFAGFVGLTASMRRRRRA